MVVDPCYVVCFMHESTQLNGHVTTELTAPAMIVGLLQHKWLALVYLSWLQNYTRCKAPVGGVYRIEKNNRALKFFEKKNWALIIFSQP